MGGIASSQRNQDTQENSTIQEVPEGNGFIFFDRELPPEMFEEIFQNVPAVDLIRSLPRVCRYWYQLLTDRMFWFRKLKREGFKVSEITERRLAEEMDDGKVLRILQGITGGFLPFNSNLIRNPSGEDEFQHWRVKHGGNDLIVECPPVGSDSIPEEAGLPTQHCFVSSYVSCYRSQTITLKGLGIEPWMLDILRPEIKVAEWVSARFDCHSKSQTSVELVTGTTGSTVHNMVWSSKHDGVILCRWYQMKMDIPYDTIPSSLTAIKFTNKSSDSQFWAGHYGAKTAGSSVILQL